MVVESPPAGEDGWYQSYPAFGPTGSVPNVFPDTAPDTTYVARFGDYLLPSVVSLTSSAVPNDYGWSDDSTIDFSWAVADPEAVVGYSFVLSSYYGGQLLPDDEIDSVELPTHEYVEGSPDPTAVLDYGLSGELDFIVKACDAAGNWGPPARISLRNDIWPPALWGLAFNGDNDPFIDPADLPLYFCVPVTVSTVGEYRPYPPYELSGFLRAELSIDDGPWTTNVVVPAPRNHSFDGPHTVEERVIDLAGNASQTSR